MSRAIAVVTSLVLLLSGGLLHGLWTERWRPSAVLEEASARIGAVPLSLGDWQGEDIDADAESFEQAGARDYWMRTYKNRQTKASVLAIFMCGRAGRMAVHTPEVCYKGAGYELFGTPARWPAPPKGDGPGDAFWTATFARPTGPSSELRLYWAWNAHGPWEAAENPRWQFRGEPFLYKLYVAHEAGRQTAVGSDAPADFLRVFLPKLRRAIFPDAPE